MRAIIVMACEVKWDPLTWDFGAGPETKARCEMAYIEYQKYQDKGEELAIVVSAGRYPGASSMATARLMANHLIREGVLEKSIIIGSAPLYTTASELEINLKLAEEKGAKKIIILSSWYHLPRLWLLTQTEGFSHLSLQFIPVFKGAKLWRFFREIPRLYFEIFRFLFFK